MNPGRVALRVTRGCVVGGFAGGVLHAALLPPTTSEGTAVLSALLFALLLTYTADLLLSHFFPRRSHRER